MLTTLIITAVSVSLIFIICQLRNYWVRQAVKEDKLSPQVIPEQYYKDYYRDWFIAITIVVVACILIF